MKKTGHWEVKLWWYATMNGVPAADGLTGNTWEAGGHFAYEDGDTPMRVLAQVAKIRGVDLDHCFEVSCRFREGE